LAVLPKQGSDDRMELHMSVHLQHCNFSCEKRPFRAVTSCISFHWRATSWCSFDMAAIIATDTGRKRYDFVAGLIMVKK